MSTKEAIDLLDRASATVSTNREGCRALEEAVKVIRDALEQKKP